MTTIYDISLNCLKLAELQDYKLYYSYATQTYIITNGTTEQFAFTHLHKVITHTYCTRRCSYSSTDTDHNAAEIAIEVICNNILCKYSIRYRSNIDYDTTNNTLKQLQQTGFVNALYNIIINGNPQHITSTKRKGYA